MKKLHLNDTPDAIIKYLTIDYPEIPELIETANKTIHSYKGSMQPYQGALCYYLASQYPDGNILEIGTGVGYSTFFLSNAIKNGCIDTLSINPEEIGLAQEALEIFDKINFWPSASRNWYHYCELKETTYDFILIDGNHKDISFDLKWYDRLNPKGLMILHDFSDETSKSPCLPVFNTANEFCYHAGDFDILVKDTVNRYGMAGWYKK